MDDLGRSGDRPDPLDCDKWLPIHWGHIAQGDTLKRLLLPCWASLGTGKWKGQPGVVRETRQRRPGREKGTAGKVGRG